MDDLTISMQPTRDRGTRPHLVAVCAFLVGSALAMSFLSSLGGGGIKGYVVMTLAGVLCTGIYLGSALSGAAARRLRWTGRACRILLILFYILWAYLAVAFGQLLAWTVPGWALVPLALAALLAAATARQPRNRPYIPIVLPLGLWIAVVLSGWPREENRLHCDDVRALRSPVELVVRNPLLAGCQPGQVRLSGRVPRTIWEAPDGKRIVFTTQGAQAPGGLDGSICEARLDGGSVPPRCVGPPVGKAHGIIDWPEHGRLLVMQLGIPTPAGSLGAAVFELPREEGITILAEHWFDEMVGDGFYEPRTATLYMASDRGNGIHRVLLPSFQPLPVLPPAFFIPDEVRYDPLAGEGIACGHHIGAAIRGNPFALRFLADGSSPVLDQLSVNWGCDWDPATRKVYSNIPNLGLLDKIDYDTGHVEKRWFVGLGKRAVAYDAAHGRVYFADFLRGNVFALDEQSGQRVGPWFVGRFCRRLRLTHDGHALLATSNLGVVRISLDG